MAMIDNVQQYIGTLANQDVASFKIAYDKAGGLNGAFTMKLTGGGNKNALTRANGNRNTRKNKNMNSDRTRKEEEKFRLSLLFSIVVLGSLTHLRGITPFIHSFMELLTVYKGTSYERIMVPFMTLMEKSFTFMGSTLLPKVKEGIYLKMLNTLNGEDILTDPNKVMATMTNVSKVYVFMVSMMAPLLQKTYTPSVAVIKPAEIEPTVRDILSVLNDTFKGKAGFTYMAIPGNSVLMIPDAGVPKP